MVQWTICQGRQVLLSPKYKSCGMWIMPLSRCSTTATPRTIKVSGQPAAGLSRRTSAPFVVCDDGVGLIEKIQTMIDGTLRPVRVQIPYGYAKDSKTVYYENFAGKIKVLKKAGPATFVSKNDGYFAWDAKSIFWNGYLLQGSRPAILAHRRRAKGALKGCQALLYPEQASDGR